MGYSSNDSVTFIVQDKTPPIIEVEELVTGIEGIPINFDANKSYDNIGIANYTWVFGDGVVEKTSSSSVIHIFGEPKNYEVELLVTDIAGNVNRTFINVVVQKDTDGDFLADHIDEDDDGDGIPDLWELNYDLDPLDRFDATLDMDGDGISNLEEYQKNTNPNTFDFTTSTLSILLVVVILFALISYGIFVFRKSRKKD
jgi:PKD repeat protein